MNRSEDNNLATSTESQPEVQRSAHRRGSVNMNLHENCTGLFQLLTETKIRDLPLIKQQKLIKTNSNDLVKDVFKTLSENDILSAPVYDQNKKEYMGMVDMKDFVDFIMTLHIKGDPIVFTAERMTDLSGTDPYIPIDEETTSIEAVKEFNIKRIHRMPMTKHNDASSLVGILTEFAIIDYVVSNKETLIPHGHMTLKQLNLGGIDHFHQVISIIEGDSLLAALSILEKYNIHGLPVVDVDGRITGSFNISDIKYMVSSDVSHEDNIRLGMSVKDFLIKYKDVRPPLLTCSPSSKFIDVIAQMMEKKVHRIHIVDAERKPVDILSLSNVIDVLLLFATGQRRR